MRYLILQQCFIRYRNPQRCPSVGIQIERIEQEFQPSAAFVKLSSNPNPQRCRRQKSRSQAISTAEIQIPSNVDSRNPDPFQKSNYSSMSIAGKIQTMSNYSSARILIHRCSYVTLQKSKSPSSQNLLRSLSKFSFDDQNHLQCRTVALHKPNVLLILGQNRPV